MNDRNSKNILNQNKNMKIILTILILILSSTSVLAQKEAFDLTTYTAPENWVKETRENAVSYINTNNKTWCRLIVYRSTASKGNTKSDFESEWNTLIAKEYNITEAPQSSEEVEAEGWKVKSGSGSFYFNKQPAIVMLTTFSGYNVCLSILATTNSQRYLETIKNFIGNVELKKPAVGGADTKPTNQQQSSNTAFKFTTTNFDDGWTATEEPDWVKVTKGNTTVLLHYAKEGTTNAADPEPHINTAWNILVAPRYSNLKNYRIASPSLDPQRAYLGAGNLTDNKTGKQVYVALFRKGSSNWVEFISPDKNSFVKEFGTDINNIGWDASSDIWNPLLKMFAYNKFAVAASDITGKWASWSGSNIQYVNVYTGLDAGMGHAQNGNAIVFNANGTYNREYKGISGSPGSGNQYYGEKNNGNAIVNNWELKLTNAFKGETHVFTAQFEAVKGGRILHLWRGNIEEMHLYRVK